eukprot:347057-Chlamydomonas_euryale.AAC.1
MEQVQLVIASTHLRWTPPPNTPALPHVRALLLPIPNHSHLQRLHTRALARDERLGPRQLPVGDGHERAVLCLAQYGVDGLDDDIVVHSFADDVERQTAEEVLHIDGLALEEGRSESRGKVWVGVQGACVKGRGKGGLRCTGQGQGWQGVKGGRWWCEGPRWQVVV